METPRAIEGERRVKNDPWDIDGWQMLASEAENVSFELAQPIYERLVKQFPPTARFWKPYCEHLARHSPDDHQTIIATYDRGVQAAPTSLDLWTSYINFMTNLTTKLPGSKFEAETMQLHERALTAAGLDLNAHPLWSQYIEFLQTKTSLSDTHRKELLRQVYQRAIRNPMQNLDFFWREYNNFEKSNNSNPDAARTLIAEHQPANVDARAEYRARRTRREGLTLAALPVPPRGRAKESSQAQQWRRFIANEISNPFNLADEELRKRVVHAYESALSPMHRYPDFWIEYTTYVYGTFETQRPQPTEEKGSKTDSSASKAYKDLQKKMTSALEPLLQRATNALPSSVGMHVHANWIYSRIGCAAKGVAALDTLCRCHPSPLAFIHLIRATRKNDGRDAARRVFGRARKDDKGAHPSVYVAAALMEFSVNKESRVAQNIFEFGLKNFSESAFMTYEYVKWLLGTGDTDYARIILRKYVPEAKGTPDEVRTLWEKWLEFEELLGDVERVDHVEQQWKDKGVGRSPSIIHDVLRRSRFLGFEGLTEDEIGAIEGVKNTASNDTRSASSAGGGKRDPRTGKRVAPSTANKDGGSSSGNNRGRSDLVPQGPPLRVATEWLQRMAASMPAISAPPPPPDVLFQLIMDTPDSFADTAAGANSQATQPGKDGGIGKKRKKPELIVSNGINGQIETNETPPQDIFRARQAAKQSRMR